MAPTWHVVPTWNLALAQLRIHMPFFAVVPVFWYLQLMDNVKLRAWWSRRQGLDGKFAGKPAAKILAATGWARSVGGVGPYLTLHARGGLGRAAVDDAIVRREGDFALALLVGQGFANDAKTARKLGVADAEIEKLCDAVSQALAQGPMDPEELRKCLGRAVRNLGEAGKKKGLATTLPAALEQLQSFGEIHRIPANGRLDQQRYRYALWRPNPLAGVKLRPEDAYAELAHRFFTWIGPATLAEFQWFSGLSVKAARAAAEAVGLEPVEPGSERLLDARARVEFLAFHAPRQAQYVLVSSLDGISHLRRDVEGLLAPEDLNHSAFCEHGLMDLSSHAILDRGRLIGLWEYETESESIAWTSFIPKNEALRAAVARTEEYIRSELGDARSFSLDSPKSRAPRIAALRIAAKFQPT
jgi:hypothetical protein